MAHQRSQSKRLFISGRYFFEEINAILGWDIFRWSKCRKHFVAEAPWIENIWHRSFTIRWKTFLSLHFKISRIELSLHISVSYLIFAVIESRVMVSYSLGLAVFNKSPGVVRKTPTTGLHAFTAHNHTHRAIKTQPAPLIITPAARQLLATAWPVPVS